MATKPLSSTLPRWADTVAADPSKVSEPASGKKDIGWIVGEKPPAQWKNWLLLQCYNWLVWLDAFETEAHTWTITQTFGGGISVSNSTLNTRAIYGIGNGTAEGIKGVGGPGGNGIVAEASGAGTYALYGKGTALGVIGVRGEGGSGSVGGSFIGGGVSAGVSATAGSGGGVGVSALGILTGAGGTFQGGATGDGINTTGGATGHGAVCSGGITSGDGIQATGGPAGYGGLFTGGSNAPGIRAIGGAGNAPGVQAVPSGNGAGIEAAGGGTGIAISATANVLTTTDFIAGSGGVTGTLNQNNVVFATVTHPVGTASIKHQVRPINTIRAYLSLVTDGAGGHTIEDRAGIASVALTATTIDITFADAFATAKYIAQPTGNGATFTVTPANKTTTVCKVSSSIDPTANIIALDVVFIGRQ